jgi:hypothetical protein
MDDAVGGYLNNGCKQERIKIQELVLGLTQDRLLGIARYAGVTEDGRYVEQTQMEPYAELVDSFAELKGFYMLDDESEQRVWIDSAQCFLDAKGTFGFYSLNGVGTDGQPFAWTALGQEECCALVTTNKCIKETEDPCSISCPGPGAACECNPPATGSCMSVMSQRCVGSCSEAECDATGPDQHCRGPFTNCHCE